MFSKPRGRRLSLPVFSTMKEIAIAAEVLGISGNPIPDSNTDRAVQCILEATGLSTAFVKLSDLGMEPCRACLGCKDVRALRGTGRSEARLQSAEAWARLLGNVPCIRRGYGDQCELSGVKMLHGPAATVASLGVRRFEANEILQHLEALSW